MTYSFKDKSSETALSSDKNEINKSKFKIKKKKLIKIKKIFFKT